MRMQTLKCRQMEIYTVDHAHFPHRGKPHDLSINTKIIWKCSRKYSECMWMPHICRYCRARSCVYAHPSLYNGRGHLRTKNNKIRYQ